MNHQSQIRTLKAEISEIRRQLIFEKKQHNITRSELELYQQDRVGNLQLQHHHHHRLAKLKTKRIDLNINPAWV